MRTSLWAALCALCLMLTTSCASDDDLMETPVFGMPLQMMSYVGDGTSRDITLIEGEPSLLRYRVTPARLAPAIASLHGDSLSLVIGRVKNRAETAAITITAVEGTDDGLLSITARHSGFANNQDYALALRLSDGTNTYTSIFNRIALVAAPAKVLLLPLSTESISQREAE